MKKILDYGTPFVCNTQDYAFPSSALANNKYYRIWLYNNLLQLQLNSEGRLEYFCNGIITNPLSAIPIIQRQYIKSTTINKMNSDIIDFVRTMIEQDYYYTSSVNEYYIPNRDSYGKENFNHGIMIFGIDDYKEELYAAGYTKDWKYEVQKISFKNFAMAFDSLSKESGCNCFKYNGLTLELDRNLMESILAGYIESEDCSYIFGNQGIIKDRCLYGVDACKYVLTGLDGIDMRNYHIMYEYSVLMYERIKCLEMNGADCDINNILEMYSEIVKKKRSLMYTALKKSMRNEAGLGPKAWEMCSILENEKSILIELLASLKKKHSCVQSSKKEST